MKTTDDAARLNASSADIARSSGDLRPAFPMNFDRAPGPRWTRAPEPLTARNVEHLRRIAPNFDAARYVSAAEGKAP